MLGLRVGAALLLGGGALVLVLHGTAQSGRFAALAAVADADPLELARVVDREGDSVVLRGMAEERPGIERLAAVRASPWMDAPGAALPGLVALAAGRDSELAPAAARAALRIAARGDAAEWFATESSRERWQKVVEGFERLNADTSARADIRLMAGQTAAMLHGIGPAGEPDGGA